MSYVILDVETTGQEDGGDIIQIAIFNPNGESFLSNVRPECSILPSAMVIHGIDNKTASDYPSRDYVAILLNNYITKNISDDTIVLAHNSKFDLGRILANFNITFKKTCDTLRMARKVLKQADTGNFKLDTIYAYLFPDKLKELMQSRTSHDAMRDCKITNEMYIGLISTALATGKLIGKPTHDNIMTWVNSPFTVNVWPFGKHKGKPLTFDMGYADWYLRQTDVDPDIKWSLEQIKKDDDC